MTKALALALTLALSTCATAPVTATVTPAAATQQELEALVPHQMVLTLYSPEDVNDRVDYHNNIVYSSLGECTDAMNGVGETSQAVMQAIAKVHAQMVAMLGKPVGVSTRCVPLPGRAS